jgi:hypothetical protein
MMGSTGAIMATTIFRVTDAPKYIPGSLTSFTVYLPRRFNWFLLTIGLSTAIASQGVLIAIVSFTTWRLSRLNKAMREGKRKEPLEGQPGFYYTLWRIFSSMLSVMELVHHDILLYLLTAMNSILIPCFLLPLEFRKPTILKNHLHGCGSWYDWWFTEVRRSRKSWLHFRSATRGVCDCLQVEYFWTIYLSTFIDYRRR